MSSASFSSSSSRKTTKGFRQSDISNFMLAGDVQATAPEAKKLITEKKAPGQVERVDTTTKSQAGGIAKFFGAKDEGTKHSSSGFLGQFSDKTEAEVQALSALFLQRSKQIDKRRGQFGRSGLLLSRN